MSRITMKVLFIIAAIAILVASVLPLIAAGYRYGLLP
jgi:hypothetical protein